MALVAQQQEHRSAEAEAGGASPSERTGVTGRVAKWARHLLCKEKIVSSSLTTSTVLDAHGKSNLANEVV